MSSFDTPSSILIIGSGVFGLSTAFSLAKDPQFAHSDITLVDQSPFPAPDSASIDTSRIIRGDYGDPAYARLALSARDFWRADLGAQGRYFETGLVLTFDRDHGQYVNSSLQNVKTFEEAEKKRGITPTGLTELRDKDEIRRVTKVGGCSGEKGYVNHGSGWADSEMSMRFLRARVEATGRVKFVTGSAKRLLQSPDNKTITGAILAAGTRLKAALTIVAAGAWTGALVDLRGVVTATGQILAYVELSPEEQEYLSKCPTQFNMSTCLFMVPPPPAPSSAAGTACEASRHNYLKIGRHSYGYANPMQIANPESREPHDRIRVSLPHTRPSAPHAAQAVPAEALEACRSGLREFIPSDPSRLPPGAPKSIATIPSRAFAFARLCHYSDTPSGNFLIAYHPKYNGSLFVATGGSGHAFKFLPVLGDEVVKCIRGECHDDFKERWAWPGEEDVDKARKQAVEEGGSGWTIDGSRGGRKGMVLEREMARGIGGAKL